MKCRFPILSSLHSTKTLLVAFSLTAMLATSESALSNDAPTWTAPQSGIAIPSPQTLLGDGKTEVFIPILAGSLDVRVTAKADVGTVRSTFRNSLP